MTLLSVDLDLTGCGRTEQLAAKTHAGMAHFAGTGPVGTSCRQCRFWVTASPKTALKASCAKTKQLSHGRNMLTFPPVASCRHFEGRE